jgi:hypothetical protein
MRAVAVSWLCATISIAGWPRGAKLRARARAQRR